MTDHERLRLVDRLVQLYGQIMNATAAAAWPPNKTEFDSAMGECRRLRAEQARIQAKLDSE